MQRVNLTLDQDLFSTYRQSIVVLDRSGNRECPVHGVELLNRPSPSSEFAGTEAFYAFVAAHGKSGEVDVFAVRLGLQRWKEKGPGAGWADTGILLFLNVHLSTLFTSGWESLAANLPVAPSSLVLELSEREGLDTYSKQEVSGMIRDLQSAGFRIAVDDLGMGYSGLYTLSVVHPEYVKIDRQLAKGIDEDRYRQHMMKALVEYWRSEAVSVIAEGVETDGEARFFADIGVPYAQGYWFHRPEPV